MDRLEINLQTRERKVVTLTPEEEAVALAQKVAWDADNTLDKRAGRAIDSADRLQFEVLFNVMNDLRELRAFVNILRPGSFTAAQAAQITPAQFRQALIDRWKTINGGA